MGWQELGLLDDSPSLTAEGRRAQVCRDKIDRTEEMMDRAVDCVLQGYSPRAIAVELGIGYEKALRLREEIFRRAYQNIESRYGPDELERMKHQLTQTLLVEIDDCKEKVRLSRDSPKGLNVKPYNLMNQAVKQLSTMHGFNAPTHIVNHDVKLYAAVQPRDMQRVLADPRARAAMLEFEEAVGAINAADGGVTIDIGSGEDGEEGGGA